MNDTNEDIVIDMTMDIVNQMDRTHLLDNFEVAVKLNEIQLTSTINGALFKITIETVDKFDY